MVCITYELVLHEEQTLVQLAFKMEIQPELSFFLFFFSFFSSNSPLTLKTGQGQGTQWGHTLERSYHHAQFHSSCDLCVWSGTCTTTTYTKLELTQIRTHWEIEFLLSNCFMPLWPWNKLQVIESGMNPLIKLNKYYMY